MIRHILLVKAKPEAEPALLAAFAGIAGLAARLPGMGRATSCRSESPEGMERGYTHALAADFADWAALKAYAEDAEHQRLGGEIVAAAQGGRDGLLVVDIEVPGGV